MGRRWINLFETHANAAREDEYNDWFVNVHVPDVLATPGFVRARRFVERAPRDGRGKYLALYDIDSGDIDETLRLRREHRAEEARLGRSGASRGPDLSLRLWLDVLFRELVALDAPGNAAGAGRWLCMEEEACIPGREAQFHEGSKLRMAEVLRTPGFVAARRYEIAEPRDGRGRFLALYEIETDDLDATLERRPPRPVPAALGHPVWRDVLWRQVMDRRASR